MGDKIPQKKQLEATQLIETFRNLPREERFGFLVSANNSFSLVTAGHGQHVVDFMKTSPGAENARILLLPLLFETFLRNGFGHSMLNLLKGVPAKDRALLLSGRYVISKYLSATHELACATCKILLDLPSDLQTKVLCTPLAISSLARQGLALDIFTLISWLDENQKAHLRTTKGYDEVMSFCSRRPASRQPKLEGFTVAFALSHGKTLYSQPA